MAFGMSAPSLGAPEGAPGQTGAVPRKLDTGGWENGNLDRHGVVPLTEAWSKAAGKATAIALRETLAKLSAEQGVNREPETAACFAVIVPIRHAPSGNNVCCRQCLPRIPA
jgi:hypothetical protein